MNSLLVIKWTDLSGQIICGLSGIVISIINDSGLSDILFSYWLLGGWQILSLLIHFTAIHEKWVFKKDRLFYARTILWLLLAGFLSWLAVYFDIYVILLFLFLLLVISPFLGIWYAFITYTEIKRIRHNK